MGPVKIKALICLSIGTYLASVGCGEGNAQFPLETSEIPKQECQDGACEEESVAVAAKLSFECALGTEGAFGHFKAKAHVKGTADKNVLAGDLIDLELSVNKFRILREPGDALGDVVGQEALIDRAGMFVEIESGGEGQSLIPLNSSSLTVPPSDKTLVIRNLGGGTLNALAELDAVLMRVAVTTLYMDLKLPGSASSLDDDLRIPVACVAAQDSRTLDFFIQDPSDEGGEVEMSRARFTLNCAAGRGGIFGNFQSKVVLSARSKRKLVAGEFGTLDFSVDKLSFKRSPGDLFEDVLGLRAYLIEGAIETEIISGGNGKSLIPLENRALEIPEPDRAIVTRRNGNAIDNFVVYSSAKSLEIALTGLAMHLVLPVDPNDLNDNLNLSLVCSDAPESRTLEIPVEPECITDSDCSYRNLCCDNVCAPIIDLPFGNEIDPC